MKRILLTLVLVFALVGSAQASVYLFVDAAPNSYGSPDYPGWESTAFAGAANGSFTNMLNSYDPANAGTTNFHIRDEVVYSFGDLGKRLTFLYWVPGESTATLDGRFEIKMENTWNGEYLDFYADYYGSTWLQPGKWVDYDSDGDGEFDGVIGKAGVAWWGAYNVNTQEALEADLAAWAQADETWTFTAKLDGVETSLTAERAATPIPGAVWLLGSGLVGLVGLKRRKRS